ncbi:aspartyl-phosphate phosphatase Spo0E family protein [Clostridium tagluense]|nr:MULTISPECIES: aspartyl-phosphate phosphatase Spo0E family protein [Clostridium]MBW9155712.1 aspartyl-phosphate phosphatase Spo0E family protein [Clostridium tagluense]MBZ9625528.1 aspartyl-phosphate phosphatase Spo0E family protein [Clostridium sp. FP2]MCB2310486.1 aspartyl-phosphate phosphatase Spo0E family protein [Clostridium tagluense]MCB2315348.1 aspartyl-phosphate phosphatase Spo0E family protein [Clostridium tagluense]MCB2320199.1 aspartyl-phosphate phosphatase Spo0E family protein [
MSNLTLDNITMEDLNRRINDLRDILNEICCTDQNADGEDERLAASRSLDKLIVEYMMGIGK